MVRPPSIIYTIERQYLLEIVNKSSSFSQILSFLNFSKNNGGRVRILKRHMNNLGIDFSHIKQGSGAQNGKDNNPDRDKAIQWLRKFDSKEDFTAGRTSLKKRLIKLGILENQCQICGILPIWNNKPLSLHLDHIDGNGINYCLDNLRLLCPNCHAQTETYGGKNIKNNIAV